MSITQHIPNTLTRSVGRALLHTSKHSPTILFAAGVVGVVATAVSASRATLKLEDILEETQDKVSQAKNLVSQEREDYTEADYKKDLTLLYVQTGLKIGKAYLPAVGIGFLTIAALTGSHRILMKRNVAITAAYAALEKGFKEYRGRVIEEFGEDADRRMRYDSTKEVVKKETPEGPRLVTVDRAGPNANSIYARFFDELCPSWSKTPEYNLIFIRAQQNYANDRLLARGHVFLNEVYDSLGIPRSKAGAVVGWVLSDEGDNYIDFGIFDGNNPRAVDFLNGREGSILLDFNVDGLIYDKIERRKS